MFIATSAAAKISLLPGAKPGSGISAGQARSIALLYLRSFGVKEGPPGYSISPSGAKRRALKGAGSPQQVFHSGHALSRGFFGSTGAAPVRFQTYRAAIAGLLERPVLSKVIDDPAAHLHPLVLPVRTSDDVFAVHVADAIFRQARVTVGIGYFTATGSVAGVPVQFEIGRTNGRKRARRFGAGSRVAGSFILDQQRDPKFAGLVRRCN